MHPDAHTDLVTLTDALGQRRAAGEAETLAPGTRFGRFRVIRPLGRGGMAVVYLCEQLSPVERLVAVKRVSGVRSDPEARLRFDIERQSLAQLNDPGIARIWDAGSTADGAAWIAMEYVNGLRLDHWWLQRQPAPLPLLRLLLKLCDAVAHAHRRGIVHCDLKPANVLVVEGIEGPQVRVIDFGIAKMATLAVESIVGTPAYMAPEQRSDPQRVDPRADVYALGVVIGEALSGTHQRGNVWAGAKAAALLERVALPGYRRRELAALLARACAEDPTARYPDALALGDELRRLLDARPLEVLADRRSYRWACRMRRHRWPLLGLATLLGLSAGYAGLAWQQKRALQAERDLAEQMVSVLLDTYRAADPIRYPGGSATARELLAGATQRLDARELPDAVRTRVLEALADVQLNLELHADSEASLQRALGLVSGARKAELELQLATVFHHAGRHAEAEALAVRISAAQVPGSALYLDAQLLGAEVHLAQGQAAPAASYLATVDPWIDGIADAPTAQERVLRHARQRGNLAHLRGDHAAGQQSLQRALALALRLWGPKDLRTSSVLNDLALGASAAGDHAQAIRWLEEVVRTTEAARGPDSGELAIQLSNLGVALARQGEAARAEVLHRRAVGINEALLGRDSLYTGTGYNNLANALEEQRQYAEAAQHYATAARALRAAVGETHPRVGIVLHNHGRSQMFAGDLDGASALLAESQRILASTFGVEHARYRALQSTQAALALKRGDPAAAASLQALLPRLIADFGEQSREVLHARRALEAR
ncbi:MAG: serine/threonine-protein kinase [Xanthomonadales bacterium]|jgi:tetratricopeptide (TPR) repeat protein/predicted Ser/Thr protein kinase|nr:serine/threonine-protein kinase [Xanthomonadales bacterium]